MNLLAHAYLSFNKPQLLIGNMISDFVKGKKKFDYPEGIQKGIALHRAIDTFTDDHAATKEARQYFKPSVGLYSGAFVDVAYDHFLANDINEFTDASLKMFSLETYNTLTINAAVLPAAFAVMVPYMAKDNWLYNYRNLLGLEKSFGGLVRRAAYLNSSHTAFAAFKENYAPLQKCYNNFFPHVKEYAAEYVKAL
jgi:acyl carrier protein phosphodiesterase